MPVEGNVLKYYVAHDELFLKGKNGLNGLLPFIRLDNKKKAILKVGMTSQDVATRIENYHSFHPLGSYIVMSSAYPRVNAGQHKTKF